MKRLGAALVLAAALAAGAAWAWKRYEASPVGPPETTLIAEIPKGMGFAALPERLAWAGIVSRPQALALYLRLRPPAETLKAGEYELSGAMTPAELIARVTSGKTVLRPFTVPEGLTLREIAALAEERGFAAEAAVLRAARDPRFVGTLAIPAESVEGYLFPDTYNLPKGAAAEDLLRAMAARFREAYSPAFAVREKELGMTTAEVVTLASIVEKETGLAEERPLIAAVFHNRLKKNMRLQSDPTVIYGMPEFDGNLTRKDLEAKTAYNTYAIAGLPPGPIANPGEASLRAALWPAESDALYFVAKGDGSHVFSRDLAAHNRAVAQYQRGG